MLAMLLMLAAVQPKPEPPTRIETHVVRPAKVDATEERIAALEVPKGYTLSVFARGLGKPRMLAVASDGTVYVTRRGKKEDGGGDVLMLRDDNRDGVAEIQKPAIERLDHAHGIAVRESRVYIATVNELFVFARGEDGALSGKRELLKDLPDAGQHPNRTIAFSPAGELYMSIGSTCNACYEPDELAATMTIVPLSGDGLTAQKPRVYAKGLRNTIGFDWHPVSGRLWGMDHGIDFLGDNEQGEELNVLEEGKEYGWPVVHTDGQINAAIDLPPGGESKQDWAKRSTKSVLSYTAHAAPLAMLFCTDARFGQPFVGDAFVTMHGSWNRKPPSGYEVVRVAFTDTGEPESFEPFISGWLLEGKSDEPTSFGRPCGMAWAADGALLIGDDQNGVIYRVAPIKKAE